MLERKDAQVHGGKGSALPVRIQLAEAATKDQAATIIKEGFLVRLKRTLMIGLDEVVNEKVPLVEQGIDSLMAVEIRAWFLKELDVDIPVLKVLGGSNITDLLQEAMDRVPTAIVDFSALSNAKASAPATNTATPLPEVHITGSASDSSRSLTPVGSSTSRPSTPVRTPLTEIDDPTSSLEFLSVATKTAPKLQESVDTKTAPKIPESVSPMSYGQARFWFLSDYLEDKTSFNMSVMFKLTGRLQASRLERAVRTVAHRHDALRTRFFWGGEGDKRVAMQGISSESSIELEHVRITSEADAKEELRKMHTFTWDLNDHQAARMVLLTINDNEHYFMTSGHHISWDGYGFTVLFIDLDAAYRGEPLSLAGPETQYPAFAAWQRDTYASGGMKRSIDEYYRPMIDPEARPLPLFPFARAPNRPLLDHFEQFEAKVTIRPDVVNRLKQVSRKNGATMFHLYLAALQALVFRLLPEEKTFYLGVADANRLDKNFMGSLGFFLNLLPVRFDRTAPGTKSSDMIKDTRNKAYKALENSFVPWDVLLHELKIPRTNTEAPIFQLFVDYRQITRDRAQWCGCNMSDEDWLNARNGYDLTLGITDNPTGESLLSLRFQKKLYSEESTEMFLRSYVNVLEALASGKDLLVDDLPRWAGSDVEKALTVGRGPQLELQWPVTVSHRIEQMIGAKASKPALKDEHNNMSYAQMGHRINTIAAALTQAGATSGTPVGVFQTPSSDWICSMLAIFRIGATYIPLDLRNSVARVSYIVEIAQPLLILTDHSTTQHVVEIHAGNAAEIVVSKLATETAPPTMANQAMPDSPAVTLFTSGTTGRPKGVVLTHANLHAQCEGYSRLVGLPSMTSVVLQQTNYNFDVSLDQIFAALAEGGCLYVVPAAKRGDPQAITKIMAEQGVTYTVATPSEYETWFRYAPETLAECKSWGYAFGGGEHLNNGLIGEFAALSTKHIPDLRLFNNYGPTEASLAITKGEVDYKSPNLENHVPAGWIIPNYAVAIVDENLNPVPLETVGEIVAGGPGISAGYLGRTDLTQEKFIPGNRIHRLAAQHSDTWYRTGDRGYLRPDGALFVHGRILGDTQVKIRGFRVELQEIENVILETAKGALTHAVVSLRGDGEDKFLTAHVVFAPDFATHLRQDTIRHLEAAIPLPSYMQPAVIVPLPNVPVTTNFKIDRNAIQALPLPQATAGTENLANMEGQVAALWRIIIPHLTQELTPESDFFAVGGNSILLVKLQAAIKRELRSAPQLIDLINSSSLGGMSRHVRAAFINRIDWELETSVPSDLSEKVKAMTSRPRKASQNGLTVIMTGASGYLGRHILTRLVESANVRQINCLVRPEHLHATNALGSSSKISLIAADISQSSLGIDPQTFAELAKDADIVFHCAANRSFWDGFESLRQVNFDAAKDLARLCATNDAVLHFMSSGSVSKYSGMSPPTDGSDGYIASKWAAEEFLRGVAKLGIRVHVHRPLALAGEEINSLDQEDVKNVQEELARLMAHIGKRPEFSAMRGYIDVKQVSDVSTSIVHEILASLAQESDSKAAVKNHGARLRLHIKDFAEQIRGNEELGSLPPMDALQWFGAAKRAGFSWLIGAMEMSMEGGGHNGAGVQILVQR